MPLSVINNPSKTISDFLEPGVLEKEWQHFNLNLSLPDTTVSVTCHNKTYKANSYSKIFFGMYALKQFLNTNSKKILQFGASVGNHLKEFSDLKWEVLAYEYCPEAIASLQDKQIPCRPYNLDSMVTNITPPQLSYSSQLQQDLQNPLNIFAFRIFEYLNNEPLALLLAQLINQTQIGTVFFISNAIPKDKASHQIPAHQKNYIASFFAPRTDMAFDFHKLTNPSDTRDNKCHTFEELLVVRKI